MSKSKIAKEPLTPGNVRRLLEDVERKGELKGDGVLRALSDCLKYSDAIIKGAATDLEIEAFFKRLYLIFTEIEAYHREVAAEPIGDLAEAKMAQLVTKMGRNVMRVHAGLRKILTADDLVLIDLRRHAACHVSVDGNQIRLVGKTVLDRRSFSILAGEVLTVEQQDAHIVKARTVEEIAKRVRKVIELLMLLALPLHTPLKGWAHNKVHAVQEHDGSWKDIAAAARVDLTALLELNAADNGPPPPDAVPLPGTVIVLPE